MASKIESIRLDKEEQGWLAALLPHYDSKAEVWSAALEMLHRRHFPPPEPEGPWINGWIRERQKDGSERWRQTLSDGSLGDLEDEADMLGM